MYKESKKQKRVEKNPDTFFPSLTHSCSFVHYKIAVSCIASTGNIVDDVEKNGIRSASREERKTTTTKKKKKNCSDL